MITRISYVLLRERFNNTPAAIRFTTIAEPP
jgi:hypothetical protein